MSASGALLRQVSLCPALFDAVYGFWYSRETIQASSGLTSGSWCKEFKMRILNRQKLSLVVAVLLPMAIIAKKDKSHNDAFMPDGPNEARMTKDIRHQLLLLPYYGVFDDLAFKVDGGTVTLMGAVTRPTLKSDAE